MQRLKIALSEQASKLKKHLGLDLIAQEKQWSSRFATTGLIDCLPLVVVDQVHCIALRGDPESEDVVVVVTNFVHGESMMICEDLSNFAPTWIVTNLVNAPSAKWENWVGKKEEEWKELTGLHQALGGEDSLEAVRGFLELDKFKKSLCNDLEGMLWTDALPAAFTAAAPDSDRGLFQKVIKKIAATGWSEEYHDLSSSKWKQPLQLVAGLMGFPEGKPDRTELLKDAVKIPTGHDSQWSDLNGVNEYSGLASKKHGAPLLIANAYKEKLSKADGNSWESATNHMVEAGEQYSGNTHFELMDTLRKKGDYAGSWNAGLIFCYWQYQKFQQVDAEIQLLLSKMAEDFFPDNLWPIVRRNLPQT